MKKILCLLLVFSSLSIISCTKECSCTDEDGNIIGTVKSTNNDCEEACKEMAGRK